MKVQKILLIFIMCFTLSTIVLATDTGKIENEWTDFSKATMQLEKKNGIGYYSYYRAYDLKVENVDFKEESKYYVFIDNSLTKPTFGTTEEELERNAITVWNKDSKKIVDDTKMDKFIEKKGDIYVWIVESKMNNGEYENKEVLSARKVEKPQIGEIGTRMEADVGLRYTRIYMYEPHDSMRTRKVDLKIGKVVDGEILQAIKEDKDGALEKLMDYSKKDTPIYKETVEVGTNTTRIEEEKLEENECYYIHIETQPEEEYNEMEDISLYQAVYEEGGTYGPEEEIGIEGIKLENYKSNKFDWNKVAALKPTQDPDKEPGGEETPKPTQNPDKEPDNAPTTTPTNQPTTNVEQKNHIVDNTTANKPIPQTGEAIINTILILAIVIIGITCFIKYKNYKEIKP